MLRAVQAPLRGGSMLTSTSKAPGKGSLSKREIKPLGVRQSRDVTSSSFEDSVSKIFDCEEETTFYAECLRALVLKSAAKADDNTKIRNVAEFGSGDAKALISAFGSCAQRRVVVDSFEICEEAATAAKSNIKMSGLSGVNVHNGCFFEAVERQTPDVLVSNPPYLPAPDDDILLPLLFGGVDGGAITRDLISLDITEMMLLIPSYSDPEKTMQHALERNYIVKDFRATKMPFGIYSSQPKVYDWILSMKNDGRAFATPSSYHLLGVLFSKGEAADVPDLATEALVAFRSCA